MNKISKIIVAILVIAVIGLGIMFLLPAKTEDNEENIPNGSVSSSNSISSVDDLINMVDKIYKGISNDELPKVETTAIEVSETDTVKMLTGLDNGDHLEYLVVSQPLMSSQAYSLVLAKVKNGVNANNVAEKMCNNVDTRRWICVEAEKVNASSDGSIVCMVMAESELADKVYKNFKALASSIGKEYTRQAEEIELPEDMY